MSGTLFSQFLRNPKTIGAICPSSPGLAAMLVRDISLEKASSVAELGPGTGAITQAILQTVGPHCRFFAVELNQAVLQEFSAKFPAVKVFHDSAANLPAILAKEQISGLDAIVSSLPWAAFPDTLQEEILKAVRDSLTENGVFVTFAYLQGTILPAGIKFRKKLKTIFPVVEKSPVVWKNIPPAFVYRCKLKN